MYAVILDKSLLYLGLDNNKAIEIFNSKPNCEIHQINSVEELSKITSEKTVVDNDLSEAAQKLVQKLDEFGINQNLAETVRENSERVLAEVRYIGLRGMKTVGEGFIALGDLLREASEESQSS
jgi:hypothetical protein